MNSVNDASAATAPNATLIAESSYKDCQFNCVGINDQIAVTVDLQFQHGQPTNSIRRRRWRDFDYDKFREDLSSSALLCDPPRDAVGLFTCYHDTLQALVLLDNELSMKKHVSKVASVCFFHLRRLKPI